MMSVMSALHADLAEAGQLPQPDPSREDMEPAHAEAMRAQIRALPRWAWIYLPEANRAGICCVCRAPLRRLSPIYATRSGRRLAWHPACCPMPVENRLLGGVYSECGLPQSGSTTLAPGLPEMPPAQAEAGHSHTQAVAYWSTHQPSATCGVPIPRDADLCAPSGAFSFSPFTPGATHHGK